MHQACGALSDGISPSGSEGDMKGIGIFLVMFIVFVFSATYGKYSAHDSCKVHGMFTYNNTAYRCSEIKP